MDAPVCWGSLLFFLFKLRHCMYDIENLCTFVGHEPNIYVTHHVYRTSSTGSRSWYSQQALGLPRALWTLKACSIWQVFYSNFITSAPARCLIHFHHHPPPVQRRPCILTMERMFFLACLGVDYNLLPRTSCPCTVGRISVPAWCLSDLKPYPLSN